MEMLEKAVQWLDRKSGMEQVLTISALLYAISTPVAVIAGYLAA